MRWKRNVWKWYTMFVLQTFFFLPLSLTLVHSFCICVSERCRFFNLKIHQWHIGNKMWFWIGYKQMLALLGQIQKSMKRDPRNMETSMHINIPTRMHIYLNVVHIIVIVCVCVFFFAFKNRKVRNFSDQWYGSIAYRAHSWNELKEEWSYGSENIYT